MPELYSEYDGLAEKWATPLHTTSGLTVELTGAETRSVCASVFSDLLAASSRKLNFPNIRTRVACMSVIPPRNGSPCKEINKATRQ